MVKNLPTMWEIWVQSLDWEDSLDGGVATHSSILAWRIPMDRGAGRATVHGGGKASDTTEQLSTAAKVQKATEFCMLFLYPNSLLNSTSL